MDLYVFLAVSKILKSLLQIPLSSLDFNRNSQSPLPRLVSWSNSETNEVRLSLELLFGIHSISILFVWICLHFFSFLSEGNALAVQTAEGGVGGGEWAETRCRGGRTETRGRGASVEPVCVQGHSVTKISSWLPDSNEDKNEVQAALGLLLAKTKIQERFCQSLLNSLRMIWSFSLFFSAAGWATPVNYHLEEFSLQYRSFAN